MKKALFILNPESGSQNFWDQVEGIIGCLILNEIVSHVEVCYTKKQYDARKAAESLTRGQYDVVVAVGGDGTVSDVINGIIKSQCKIPVAIIPAGTSNVFAHVLELPDGKEDFCRMLRSFQTVELDVGKVNDRYFITTLAGGMGADISYKAASDTKAVFGKKAYFFEALRSFPREIFRPMKLYLDSEEFTGQADTVLFYISNAGGVAGNKRLFDASGINDGYLSVAVFQKMPVFQFAKVFWRFIRGKYVEHPRVKFFTTKRIRIKSMDGSSIPVNSDGDRFGTLPVNAMCLHGGVKIVVPRR